MMMRRSDRKPPLARSPVGVRTRRVLQSTPNAIRTPPGSLTKTQVPKRASSNVEEWELRPEYRTISCELRALAKMVKNEFGNEDVNAIGNSEAMNEKRSPLFERGRFYEEYSARRNERLKRKKGDIGDEKKPAYDLGVRVESSKKRGEPKVYQSARNSVASTPMAERRETPRYFLRSAASKENKKPPLPVSMDKFVGFSERKTTVRRVRKI
ncbi:PREDICTED: uncharacterized protein LOC109217717 [Nicotiana attenuata]|uniref:Uncharacterized protein n=1 Tax=Nicotiana attenuata TaxID=49451 RepID=A0A1J6KTA6_NICAT|nr:PREDICTED: uncharacterized protein LOC109217717 [Nicotiana attenuata]XP_019237529.1 PREDICTED: uncharacterized protein LOC109217717 [Nicotiana attenuata]OIT22353.1 hypothetical protein A4A49_31040 [Nicotiana attenuata]